MSMACICSKMYFKLYNTIPKISPQKTEVSKLTKLELIKRRIEANCKPMSIEEHLTMHESILDMFELTEEELAEHDAELVEE